MSSIEQVASRAEGASTALVLRPQTAVLGDVECKGAIVGESADVELLGVSFSQPPAVWYDEWTEALGNAPEAAAVITTPELAGGNLDDRDIDVETVASPSNLTGIGVKSTPYLSQWDDALTVVESLTVPLRYTDTQSVYKFVHVLTSRLQATDAAGQFYLDPAVEDERTVELFKTLFDAVVECEVDTDGGDPTVEWSVTLRDG
ncbi:DUF7504 family protein [Halobellus rarus]|uniref:Uncharacterized protein n=1 Tax=Halobellus rarus TaxID=1126237 RepID=A0ABD6CLC3_9EURY|nr:hypothetical protein [Halobellus rarus]